MSTYASKFLKSAGQDCKILRNNPVQSKVSLKRSTRAIRDFGVREAHWEGLILLASKLISGDYLELHGDTYLVQSVNFDPASGELFWHGVKTNATVIHKRSVKEVDADRNVTFRWDTINGALLSFCEIITVEMRNRDPGILQATRFYFQVSKDSDVRKLDRIIFDGVAHRADAVNDLGMPGVVRIQASEDNRA